MEKSRLICPNDNEICLNYHFAKDYCEVQQYPQCTDCNFTKKEYIEKIKGTDLVPINEMKLNPFYQCNRLNKK